jgi:hypothetical protein
VLESPEEHASALRYRARDLDLVGPDSAKTHILCARQYYISVEISSHYSTRLHTYQCRTNLNCST